MHLILNILFFEILISYSIDIAVGQNLYMSYSDAPLGNGEVFTAAAEDWWSEVNDFNKRSIDGFQ